MTNEVYKGVTIRRQAFPRVTAIPPTGKAAIFLRRAQAYRWIDENFSAQAPTLASISPTTATSGQPVTLTATGGNMIPSSKIVVNNSERATTFVDAQTLRCTLTIQTQGALPVVVRTPGYADTAAQTLNVTLVGGVGDEGEGEEPGGPDAGLPEAPEQPPAIPDETPDHGLPEIPEEQPPTFPIGPISIVAIASEPEVGLRVTPEDIGPVYEGDTVLIEATGHTDINGEYTATQVGEESFIIDNPAVDVFIENRGRLTITAGGNSNA
jgi:hypothetical protein